MTSNMQFFECSNFNELLAKRRKDAPQAIVAGWFLPNGKPIGANATVADKTPTEGEMAVAWACCLAACFKKLDELLSDNPERRDQLMQLVFAMTDGLEVVAKFKSGLVSPAATAGCRDEQPELF